MEKQKIRRSLFGLFMIVMLSGVAQEALAQGTVKRNDVKRPERSTVKKEKEVKQSPRRTVRKSQTSKPTRVKEAYSRNENRKRPYRDSNRSGKSYERNRDNAYKYRDTRHHIPTQRIRHHGPYRRPGWVDYHRSGYRYPIYDGSGYRGGRIHRYACLGITIWLFFFRNW